MEKIKVLLAHTKKVRKNAKVKTIGDIIEMVAPDAYDFYYVHDRSTLLRTVDELRPEIVFLPNQKHFNALELVKEIKSLYPSTAIFVMLSGMEEYEQKTIEDYRAAGAYKCCLATLAIEGLVHDMYVALNLE